MWHSNSIVSLKAIKSILEFMCISPFQKRANHSKFIYYMTLLIVYEITFCTTVYLKFCYSGKLYIHQQRFDTVYFMRHMTWFLQGCLFSFGVIISWSNLSAQELLIERMAALDTRIKSHLKVDLSFRRLNIEFVAYSIAFTIYIFGDYSYDVLYASSNSTHSKIYYFCCCIGTNFFYIYALYAVFWARVFLNRSQHIIEALKVATSQRYISKDALTIIMQLIKLLFDVRESIQSAFGSMLCVVIGQNSILIAISMFLTYNDFDVIFTYNGVNTPLWALGLWLEIIYIVVYFDESGDVVSAIWK